MLLRLTALVVFAFFLTACGTSGALTEQEADALQTRVDSLEAAAARLQTVNDSLSTAAQLRHPNLNSTLWQQTAVEYAGTTRGAYQLAAERMEDALQDSIWTASIEQSEMGSSAYRSLPPAVVLDVDETVLDNAPYQARLVEENQSYSSETWNAWCREEQAGAVPGALEFTQAAADRGVQVIYLTNRDASVEAATRRNLRRLGFPIDEEDVDDAVLTQGEREGWEPKEPRREWVAERFRILLLIGDNFGDFTEEAESSLSIRERTARAYRKYWGTRWIVLPNAQYGSWEAALYDFDYGLPALETLQTKHDRLQTKKAVE